MKPRHTKNTVRTSMDWGAIKQRLEQTEQAIEALSQPDPIRQQEILRERSLDLARAAGTSAPAATMPDIEVLSFQCAGERYAFESGCVARVCSIGPITSIPGTPDFVVGVISVLGEILSVIDLRVLLKLPVSRLADPDSVIILKNETMEFGILAEEVIGTERYPLHALERSLATLSNISETYLIGVTTNRTAILNADQLLCDPRLIIEVN